MLPLGLVPFSARIKQPPSSIFSLEGGLDGLPLRAIFSPAHPLANIVHPPYPPIASQSISQGRRHLPKRGPSSLLTLDLGEWPRLPSTACIERPSSI